MCDEANSTTPVHHLDCLCHIYPGRMIAHSADYFHSSGPIWSIAMFVQQDTIIYRMEKLSAAPCEYFLLIWKCISFTKQIFIGLVHILLLYLCKSFYNGYNSIIF